MSDNDFLSKTINDITLSRRRFLKWSAALSGTAVLSGGLSKTVTRVASAAPLSDAASDGEWITAACWHNCGGQRCVIKAQVADGVVRKVKTDDTHPDTMEEPQIRACARGRSQQQQCFGADRLKYPMKRANWEPGGGNKDLRGQDEWVRISWDEALDILASELERVKAEYGNEGILEAGSTLSRAVYMAGGACKAWGSTSWGSWLDSGPIVGLGDGLRVTNINDRLQLQKSDLIVIWGGNPAWSAQGNAMKYLLDAKRAGAKFIFIDPTYNDSAMILADEWIPIRPGTDHAMALSVAYTLLEEDDPDTNSLIDWDFLNTCTYGFDRAHMPEDVDPDENFKDYVLGRSDGVPKTPEWASAYCGVPPYRIRQFARELGSMGKVSLMTAWAPARVHNSDSWPQMFMTLGAMTGNIGREGCCTGVSCWERSADGGPFLINRGGSGVPGTGVSNAVEHRINWAQVWDAVLDGHYTAGYEDERDVDIQMIIHDGNSRLNQTCGLTKGIAAHRKVEFVVSLNFVLNTNSKYADLVLPVTTEWERGGYIKGNRDHLIWARQITEPLFEAKDDIWIAAQLGERLGFDPAVINPMSSEQQAFNRLASGWIMNDNGVDRDTLLTITQEDIEALGVEGEPQEGRYPIQEFKEKGVITVPRSHDDNFTHIFLKEFRDNPEENPLETATGKLEIHSQALADFIKSKGFTEVDPIPTYTPPIEGYQDTFEDWDNKVRGEFPYQLVTQHYRRRSHSIFDNIPWLREAFPQEFMMNPIDAEASGVKHGDIAKISSRHGVVLRPVFIYERVMPGVVILGEGAWAQIDEETGYDRAGATNTLNGHIATGQGHQGWNTCNVKVEYYGPSSALEQDYKWPQRIPIKEA